MEQYIKRGYLNSEFRLFHLTDQETREVEYHYHDFDKITIFIKGCVNYWIEGKSYELKPYDIVLVKHNDIHRLTIDSSRIYERIIVYISPNFMNAYKTDSYDLSYCFQKAEKERSNVLRIPSLAKSSLFRSITRLEQSFADGGAIPPGTLSGIYDPPEPGRNKESPGIHRHGQLQYQDSGYSKTCQ